MKPEMIDFLIVEDSDTKYRDIERLVKSIRPGFYIKRVDNIGDAIVQLKKRQYSFVLVDIQLPNKKESFPAVNSNAGIELIQWIKHNQKRGKCLPPENILVLSEHKHLIEEHSSNISKTRVFSYLYDSQSEDWELCVKDCIEEFLITKDAFVTKSNDEAVIYSVHGINTNGEWQSEFDVHLSKRGHSSFNHRDYKYQGTPLILY